MSEVEERAWQVEVEQVEGEVFWWEKGESKGVLTGVYYKTGEGVLGQWLVGW